MENMNHTPEPWEVSKVGHTYFIDQELSPFESIAKMIRDNTGNNARRIVACVNACKGLDTEILESGTVVDAVQMALKHSAEAEKMKVIAEKLYDALTVCRNLLKHRKQNDIVGKSAITMADDALKTANELRS